MIPEIVENYRHSNLRYESGVPIELDIFLPKERLAFEYQGEHHYLDVYRLGLLWQHKQKDKEKKMICMEREITLIEVPYWWDKKTSSLAASICKERKDFIPEWINGEPIPLIPTDKETLGGKFITN